MSECQRQAFIYVAMSPLMTGLLYRQPVCLFDQRLAGNELEGTVLERKVEKARRSDLGTSESGFISCR